MIQRFPRQQGFTLVELVVTLLVSAIMTIGVISYIGDAVDGFSASSHRSKLAASGRVAVDRMTLELYNAVPNSLRTSADNQCLEFMPVVAATSYIDPAFTGSGTSNFQAVRLAANTPTVDDLYAVIFPIDTGALYRQGSPGPIAAISDIDDTNLPEGLVTLELTGPHLFERRSPVDRLYLAGTPVSFCVVNDLLFRYQNYGVHEDQCTPATCLPSQLPDRALISRPLDNTGLQAFRVEPPTLRRNAIVTMNLNFAEAGDTVNMRHEVMTRNVP